MLNCWCSASHVCESPFTVAQTKDHPNTFDFSNCCAYHRCQPSVYLIIIISVHRLPNGSFGCGSESEPVDPKAWTRLFIFNARRHHFGDSLIFTPDFSCVCVCCVYVGARSGRQENVSIFKYPKPSMFCHRSTTSSVGTFNSIQFNSMKTCMRWMANCVAATQRHRHTELEHLVIHTASGSVGIVPHTLDVINNLRWKSKPDFWFSFFIFSHISSTRASALARCHLSICWRIIPRARCCCPSMMLCVGGHPITVRSFSL